MGCRCRRKSHLFPRRHHYRHGRYHGYHCRNPPRTNYICDHDFARPRNHAGDAGLSTMSWRLKPNSFRGEPLSRSWSPPESLRFAAQGEARCFATVIERSPSSAEETKRNIKSLNYGRGCTRFAARIKNGSDEHLQFKIGNCACAN